MTKTLVMIYKQVPNSDLVSVLCYGAWTLSYTMTAGHTAWPPVPPRNLAMNLHLQHLLQMPHRTCGRDLKQKQQRKHAGARSNMSEAGTPSQTWALQTLTTDCRNTLPHTRCSCIVTYSKSITHSWYRETHRITLDRTAHCCLWNSVVHAGERERGRKRRKIMCELGFRGQWNVQWYQTN